MAHSADTSTNTLTTAAAEVTNALAIDAPVERVWRLTVDVESWPSMTSTITSVERLDHGPIGVGSTARVVQPRQRPTVWTVSVFEPMSLFAWQTKVAGVTMVGVHRIEATERGCVNHLSVEFSGFGSRVLARLVGSKIREAITIENEGFKAAAERAEQSPTE